MHRGVDFGARTGTPIYAAASGIVEHAAPFGLLGNAVVINHPNGLQTRYAHMSEIKIRDNKVVETGDLIGLVGSSGMSTGASSTLRNHS